MFSVEVYKYINLNLERYRGLAIFLFTSILIGIAFYLRNAPIGDYANYFYGSKFFMEGVNVFDIYDPTTFNEMIAKAGSNAIFANYTPVPPFTLLFFCPFAFGDIFFSKLTFNIISILIFSLSFYRLILFQNIGMSRFIPMLLIILIPVYSNILLGQTYLLILTLLIEGYIFSVKGNKIISSVCFSVPIVLKIFPAIILIWLFFSFKRKEFWLTLLFSFLLFISVISLVSIDLVLHYTTSILPRLMIGEINDPFSISYQSITVLLKRIFIYDAHLNPTPLIDSFISYSFLNVLATVFFLISCIKLVLKYKESLFFTFGLTIFTGFLISGYGTNYSLVLLLIVGLAFVEMEGLNNSPKILYLLLFLITFFPVHKLGILPHVFHFGRLYVMIVLFFYIYPIKEFKIFNRYYFALILFFSIPSFYNFFQQKDNSSYYLSQEPSLLINSFKPISGGLMISYIERKGEDSLFYKTPDSINFSDELSIHNNQIYYKGKQVTIGKDIKKKPMLLNNKEVLYLSDMGRGVGLTGLRKVSILKSEIGNAR